MSLRSFLREDVSENRPFYAGTDATVPDEFRHQFVMALLRNHVNMTIFAADPNRITQMVASAWADPTIQSAWTDPDAIASAQLHGYPNPDVSGAIADALFNPKSDSPLLTTGLGLLQESGRDLTAAQQGAIGADPLISSTEQVPNPFGRFTAVSGNDYGQAVDVNSISGGYGPIHLGVDYGTPEGTLISAPFAGTVTVERGVAGYGNKVTLTLPSGYSIVFGHVADGLAQGQVQPGQIIARSGANIGSSSGAVTLVELHAPDGSFLNPHAIFDQIMSGTNFAAVEKTLGKGLSGTGITHSATLDAEFPGARGIFAQFFGRQPTDSELMRIATAGGPNQDLRTMEDYVRALPSHIAGMAVGQYFDLRKAADTISQNVLGHLSTDGIVKELFDAGSLTDNAIKYWYNMHSPNQIDAATYNSIYAANQPHLSAIYNEKGFDPRWAAAQAGAAGSGTPPATDQAASAASLTVAPTAEPAPGSTITDAQLDAALRKSWAAAATPDLTPAPPENAAVGMKQRPV